MHLNTGLSSILASFRIVALLLGAIVAFPAFSEELGVIEVVPASPFPNLIYKNEQGETHSLKNDISQNDWGKLTIVHFWATWCGPCVEEFPQLDAIQKIYIHRRLKILDISMDGANNMQKVKEFFRVHHITSLKPYVDIGTGSFSATKARGLPTSFFIDDDGQEIAIAEGPLDWDSRQVRAFIEKHLQVVR